MAKKKLLRFAQIEHFSNVYQYTEPGNDAIDFALKGKWHQEVFKNNHPIILELGCGKGEYSVGMAKHNPTKNFIGADIKGNRIWLGAKEGLDEKLSNLAFLRTRIEQINKCFGPNEISEIWITFPDPQPQKPREKKRLTHPNFINKYKQFTIKDGFINLKTDSALFFQFTLDVVKSEKYQLIENTDNLYADPVAQQFKNYNFLTEIKTYYEKLFTAKGFNICYLRFQLH